MLTLYRKEEWQAADLAKFKPQCRSRKVFFGPKESVEGCLLGSIFRGITAEAGLRLASLPVRYLQSPIAVFMVRDRENREIKSFGVQIVIALV